MNQPAPRSIHLAAGLAIWAFWFVLIYGGHAIACEVAPPEPVQGMLNWISLALLVSGMLAAILLLLLAHGYWQAALKARRAERQLPFFVHGVAAAGCVAAALSTVFISIPVMVLPPCL